MRALVVPLLLALATPSSVALAQTRPPAADVTEARVHFARGVQAFKEGDSRTALAEFDRAYKLAPNYRLLFNIAQTCAELQDYPCALRSMEQYLADGKAQIAGAKRAAAEREVERFKVLVATLTIRVNVAGAQVLIDDRPVGASPLAEPVMVSTGQRRVSVVARGMAPVVRVVEVAGGDSQVVEVNVEEPPPAPPPPPPVPVTPIAPAPPIPAPVAVDTPVERPSRAPIWIGAVATVALGSAGAVTGMLTLSKHRDLESAVARFPQPADTADLRSQTATLGIVTDVLLGAAVVAAGTTVVLWLTRSPAAPRAESGLVVTPGGTGMVVRF